MRTRKKKTNKSNKKAARASIGEAGAAFLRQREECIMVLMAS